MLDNPSIIFIIIVFASIGIIIGVNTCKTNIDYAQADQDCIANGHKEATNIYERDSYTKIVCDNEITYIRGTD